MRRIVLDTNVLVSALLSPEGNPAEKFYEVAKHCKAKLITGNRKHFPEDQDIVTPRDFLEMLTGIVT